MDNAFDVLVIGSGAAGLSVALSLAAYTRVGVLAKADLKAGATQWAQGGIAAVLNTQEDSLESHIADTLIAGAGLCDFEAVKTTVEGATAAVNWLKSIGVPFTTAGDDYHLTQEGGHSYRRIAHADDATGLAIHNTLIAQALNHPNITLFTHHVGVDLILSQKHDTQTRRIVGCYALDTTTNTVHTFTSPHVVLATGGASKAYLYTTNPDVASGDGIAMAWRAGATVQDMEFNQFHPTCLYHPKARSFLLTEAIRGEGGILCRPDGTRFMQDFDPRAELAPRDIVARAIDSEMKRLGVPCLYLDITHQSKDFITRHFPTIYERCLSYGYDMATTPLPIVPAAHYTCGGVKTDLWARTTISGLYAVGEVASTGLHGANRMASNSLVECLVFGRRCAQVIQPQLAHVPPPPRLPAWDDSRVSDPDELVIISHNWDELRRFMWDYVGIVRTTKRLLRAQHRITLLKQEIQEFYANFSITADLLELRNLVTVADLMISAALSRHESRGLHYTRDYPSLYKRGQITHTLLERET